MKKPKDTPCSDLTLSQEPSACPTLSLTKAFAHKFPNTAITAEHNELISMAENLVAKNKPPGGESNMEPSGKTPCKTTAEEEPMERCLGREQERSVCGVHRRRGSDKEEGALTSFECMVCNGTEDWGTDSGKAKEGEGFNRKGRPKSSAKQLTAPSEGAGARTKRFHTSYRKKETRDETTMKFFSFDWFADALSKYSIGTIRAGK